MPIRLKNNKRRRSVRHPVELTATLVMDGMEPIQCTVLDFCVGGFFLELDGSNLNISPQEALTIRFSVGKNVKPVDFELKGRAVHITPQGMGLSVENMPSSAVKALADHAERSLQHALDKNAANPSGKLDNVGAKPGFRQFLIENLTLLINQFFADLPEELEKINQNSEFFANQSLLDDLLTTFKQNEEAFCSEFCYAVIEGINCRTQDLDMNEISEPADEPLSLIEKDAFEDWLNLVDIIKRLNRNFDERIDRLTKELVRVFGWHMTVENNPMSPAALCENFRDLVLQLESGNRVKLGLYRCFEAGLIKNLDIFYEQLLVLLSGFKSSEKKPPKTLSSKSETYRQSSCAGLNRTKADESKIIENELIIADYVSRSLGEPREQKKSYAVSQITGRLLDILADSEATVLVGSEKNRFEGNADRDTTKYSVDEIASAIEKLQKEYAAGHNLKNDDITLTKQLEVILDKSSLEKKSLPPESIQKIGIYDRFFKILENDFKLSSDLKNYIGQMYLPLLSLPLRGVDFLDSDSHPVSIIFNRMAALESAIKTNKIIKNLSVKSSVERLIERVSKEAITNPVVLTEVAEELDDLSTQINKQINLLVKRIVEPYEGRQKLELAKRAVKQKLDQRVCGPYVPKVIIELLESGWQDLLIIAELNKPKEIDDNEKYWVVIDDLMFWLFQQDSTLKIHIGSIYRTLEFIWDNLKSVCTDIIQRNKIKDELTALLLGVGSPKVRKRLQTVAVEPVKEVDCSPPAIDDKWTVQVEQLVVGDWLSVSNGALGVIPMKLVWIGDILQLYVFVDNDGLNKLEFGKMELAEQFRKGLAYKCDNLNQPLMERVTSSMLQNVHDKLIFNATHDSITNLYTRDEFVRLLKNEIQNLNNTQHILCRIDLVDLRLITNVCGIVGGEQLLKNIAQIISGQLSGSELSARLGDKSFAILFKNCTVNDGHSKSKRLLKLINDSHFQWQDKSFVINVCMGLAFMGHDCLDVHLLLQQADFASSSAERLGQNSILLFNNEDEALKRQNKLNEWVGLIDNVLTQDRLFIRCQMIAPIQKGNNSHLHYEILLGVRSEDGSIIPPDNFIPAVERCKRMPEIDRWIITNIFNWIESNRNCFDKMDGFSINLSVQSINSHEFLQFLKEVIEASRFPANKLIFEITETVASENLEFTKRFINAIKRFGCGFSLDDFGSGYSSYSYLKNLDVDYLKIDGAFVKDILNNKADIAIVKSMNEIAHSLNMKTIAEYVENDEIRSVLKEIGIDYGQGYGIQKPICLSELAA
ncbi:DUF1631 family protein [Methylomonas sp. MgM2]